MIKNNEEEASMAMVKCTGCGELISDKAKTCVHCGYTMIPEEKKICPECGNELEDGMSMCPKCGCPVGGGDINSNSDTPQQVEVTGVKISHNSKRKVVIIGGILIAIFIAVFSLKKINEEKERKAAEEASIAAMKESEAAVDEYSTLLTLAIITMLDGASEAEDCGNLIRKVWSNAIYEDYDSETDKFTRPRGYFVSDFNEALQNLFADSSFDQKITSIDKNQDSVQSMMKDLKNPPPEFVDAYEDLEELYDAYYELTELAVNPSGSLSTYSTNFGDADSTALKAFNKLKIYIEN